jgi:hypothetical protein
MLVIHTREASAPNICFKASFGDKTSTAGLSGPATIFPNVGLAVDPVSLSSSVDPVSVGTETTDSRGLLGGADDDVPFPLWSSSPRSSAILSTSSEMEFGVDIMAGNITPATLMGDEPNLRHKQI